MSKKGIIRVVYGDIDGDGHGESKLRKALNKDIDRALSNEDIGDFTTYVFGIDNLKKLEKKGLNCVLVDERSRVVERRHYCNKLIGIDRAMEDFDEVVYLDWDTIPIKPLPDNFWDVLRSKDVIQSPLVKVRRPQSMWRTGRILPKLTIGGFFYYIRDRSVLELPLAWATHQIELPKPFGPKWNDETYVARGIDNLMNNWRKDYLEMPLKQYDYLEMPLKQYMEEYLRRFEPLFCRQERVRGHYAVFLDKMENACFSHNIRPT